MVIQDVDLDEGVRLGCEILIGLALLSDAERHAVMRYYRGVTLQVVADERGVSNARAWQLETSGLRKLRDHLVAQGWRDAA